MSKLSLSEANSIIETAFAQARSRGMPPIAVAVLDAGGHLQSLQRGDGVSFLRVDISFGKAWGALAMGVGTRQLADRYLQGTQQEGFINALNAMTGGKVVPLPGGVLIQEPNGQVLGAVGISGAAAEDDEACAVAAVEAAGYRAVPAAP